MTCQFHLVKSALWILKCISKSSSAWRPYWKMTAILKTPLLFETKRTQMWHAMGKTSSDISHASTRAGKSHKIWTALGFNFVTTLAVTHLDSLVHGANMGPTWVLSAPDGPHVGPMKLAIREVYQFSRCAPRASPHRRSWIEAHVGNFYALFLLLKGTTMRAPSLT